MLIHQLLPALHEGDAIGDSARAIREYLRSQGYTSDIYAYTIDESIADEAIDFSISPPKVSATDILILHFALPSGMTEFLKRAECKKALIYHNITPSYYWLQYDPSLLHLAWAGRRELESLVPFVARSAADSEYNRQELEQLQFRNTSVLPIYVQQERYRISPSPAVMEAMNNGMFTFLFVGRVAPNKKLEDVMKLLRFYKTLYEPLSRVIFVGKTNVAPAYFAALKDLNARLGFMAEDVIFTGRVDWPELVAYYTCSNVFISMSEHEGFCVPLIEAMILDLPIVAYSSTAVPFTLGNAGVQFDRKDLPSIAGICERIRTDQAFRKKILETQREQLKLYSKEEIEKSIQQFLAPLI